CNPTQQFLTSSRALSAGPDGASIQAPDDFAGRTYRNTVGARRAGEPECATTSRKSARDANCARKKGDIRTCAYSTANKSRPEIFPGPASAPPSPLRDVQCGFL